MSKLLAITLNAYAVQKNCGHWFFPGLFIDEVKCVQYWKLLHNLLNKFRLQQDQQCSGKAATRGKTVKNIVLPGFREIESGGSM